MTLNAEVIRKVIAAVKTNMYPLCRHQGTTIAELDGIVWLSCSDCGLLYAMHPDQYKAYLEMEEKP